MGSIGQGSSKELPLRGKPADEGAFVYGSAAKKDFLLDSAWRNLNHGSFGTYPKAIQKKFREYQDASEARPDEFIRYEYPKLLDESRAAVAKLLNAPVEGTVFVSNATVGVNTVFKNIKWNEDGKDAIITFSTVYEACGKTADYLVDFYEGKVSHEEIQIEYPVNNSDILQAFRDKVKQVQDAGKRVRIAMFDVVSSRPGVVFPWVEMVEACRELNILSMVDGAQGVGMVHLDISAADPDFFVSNCHKWLFAPRGCAVFYVPERNHHLLPTTLPTSHGYVPKTVSRTSPLPPSKKSRFITNFEFVGTLDNSPYLCVKDAIAWRQDVLGGEDAVLAYLWNLNKKGSELLAEELGTTYMENDTKTLRNCSMSNVALPIWIDEKGPDAKEGDIVIPKDQTWPTITWMSKTLNSEYKTFLPLYPNKGRLWFRICAQVYLDIDDYKWAAGTLKELCARVAKKAYLAE